MLFVNMTICCASDRGPTLEIARARSKRLRRARLYLARWPGERPILITEAQAERYERLGARWLSAWPVGRER